MAEYELYLKGDLSELKEGEEQIFHARDTANYEMRVVKAVLSSSPEKIPGADRLWIRFPIGLRQPQPWAIKILEDLGSLPQQAGLY